MNEDWIHEPGALNVVDGKDIRNPISWAEIESNIQEIAKKKDPNFILSGDWKEFAFRLEDKTVYAVDCYWIETNLGHTFGDGGHGYVHEFIPHNEIWVSVFNCDNGERISEAWFLSTAIHELHEWGMMKNGIDYFNAHLSAMRKEAEYNLVPDSYLDNPDSPKVKWLINKQGE